MSRGLSVLEDEDPSLSETTDSDAEMDNTDETEEAINREPDPATANNGHVTANGHVGNNVMNNMAPPHAMENGNTVTTHERNISHKTKQRYYAAFLADMDEAELDRYEAYRRSCLPRPKMKKLLSSLSSLPIHDDKILIVLCSLTKMFVGQVIQEARCMATSMDESGPLRPEHVRKAFKKLESKGTVFRRSSTRPFFRHFA